MDFKDLKQHVKELMAAMGRSGIKRLAIKDKDLEIELERCEPIISHMPSIEAAPLPTNQMVLSPPMVPKQEVTHESAGLLITSPMVGTFYGASSPDAPPFVRVGDVVAKGDVVCIVEAMKVLNEIKAEISGTIAEVLVSNGDPVEFGTKLFRVR